MDFVFLMLALVCLVIGFYGYKTAKASKAQGSAKAAQLIQATVVVPETWNESAIARDLERVRRQPSVIASYVETLQTRFILHNDSRVALSRIAFLRLHLEQLQIAQQCAGVMNDLSAIEAEQKNRLLKLEVEQRELLRQLEDADVSRDLRLKRERLAVEVEIAELRARKAQLKEPMAPPNASPEQTRRLKRMEIEDRMRELDRLEAEALKNARDDEDRIRIQNMHADKREELQEQLARYLV